VYDRGFFLDNVTGGGHQAKMARSWGHKGHSWVQTPRPSLYTVELNFIMLQAVAAEPGKGQRGHLPTPFFGVGATDVKSPHTLY